MEFVHHITIELLSANFVPELQSSPSKSVTVKVLERF